MLKNAKGKQALAALLLTVSLETALLLLMGWGGASGWIDAARPLGPTLAAVSAASALGAVYLGLHRWSAVPSALLTGVGGQLLLLLAGYFAFGRVIPDGNRWWLPAAGFASSVLAVLFLAKPKTGAKKKRAKRRKKQG